MRLNSYISVKSLHPNTGQIPGLPANPREWTSGDVNRLARSIEETPELLEARPLIVTEVAPENYVILGGNLRFAACKQLKKDVVPCYIIQPDLPVAKLKEIVIKDNGAFGSWDYDQLGNEWDDLPLAAWGVPSWETDGLTTKGREGDDEYDDFVDKFKPKLTTDDCYTPQPVYDAILEFVGTLTPLQGRKVVRPFFPGGNYEDMAQYPEGCVVVDNPPFSLMSQIVRFYCKNEIPFFIFAPALTLFSATDCDVTYIVSYSDIEYENGARVRTGFITNLIPDLRIWCCPELRDAIIAAQPDEDKTKQGFVYPDNIVTAATLGKITKRSIDLRIRKQSCEPIKQSDSAQEQGRQLYGGGFIMSDRAAAERAAAERAAAERAAATRLNLSDRERAIIERLNEQDKETLGNSEKVPQIED